MSPINSITPIGVVMLARMVGKSTSSITIDI
jgi:hypothetical protein